MEIQPYLSFEGRCEEALEFYKKVLGAQVDMFMRYKDSPKPAPPGTIPPGSENKVMHSSFHVGDTHLMASDGNCSGDPKFQGVSLSISADDAAAAEKLFAGLSDGGRVEMPLTQTFFASRFGMVQDRFGLMWMVIAA